MKHQGEAYRGEPVPLGLSEEERAQYIMLRQMYADFRAGMLTQEQGERVKAKIIRFPEAARDERGMLLDFFIPRLEHELPSLKLLFRLFYEATDGRWLYVENTTLEG